MPKKNQSILVVGQGVSGLAVALRFLEAGFSVSIISCDRAGYCASEFATGVSVIKGLNFAFTPGFELKLRGHLNLIDWFKFIESCSNTKISYRVGQVYEPFDSQRDFRDCSDRAFHSKFYGLSGYRLIHKSEFFESQLCLSQLLGFRQYFYDINFDVSSVLESLKIACHRLGAKFIDAQVEGIFEQGDQLGLRLVRNLQTPMAHELIFCTGSESATLLDGLGFRQIPLQQDSSLFFKASLNQDHSSFALVKRRYSMNITNGRLRLGSLKVDHASDELDFSDRFSTIVEQEFLFDARCLSSSYQGVARRLKHRDRLPVVGEVSLPGINKRIWLATAFYKNGFQLADLGAQYVCSQITGSRKNATLDNVFKIASPLRNL